MKFILKVASMSIGLVLCFTSIARADHIGEGPLDWREATHKGLPVAFCVDRNGPLFDESNFCSTQAAQYVAIKMCRNWGFEPGSDVSFTEVFMGQVKDVYKLSFVEGQYVFVKGKAVTTLGFIDCFTPRFFD